MKTAILSLCLLQLTVISKASPAVRVAPVNQTALLNSFAEFNCTTVEGRPFWIINGLQYVSITEEPHRAHGITRTVYRGRGTEYFTVLQVAASVRNNNTEIKCRAESEVESTPVFLKVQGLLVAPANFSISHVNISTVLITWLPPFTLDGIGILQYTVVIKNSMQELIATANLTDTEYYYNIPSCSIGCLQVCVAGWNGIGAGSYTSAVDIYHAISLSDSNAMTNSGITHQFLCEAPCDNSLLVFWLINGTLLSQTDSTLDSMARGSNYYQQCSEQCQETYSESLEVTMTDENDLFVVQCASICVHQEANCSARTFYSHFIYVETSSGDFNVNTEITNEVSTTQKKHLPSSAILDSRNTTVGVSSNFLAVLAAIGAVAGVFAILCCALMMIICGLICRGLKLNRQITKTASINNEVIYEQCGDPVKVVAPALPSPRSDIHPDMQPCPAYVTAPCRNTSDHLLNM